MAQKKIYYYDISKKGKDLIGSGDVNMLTNEQAIKESIYNLIFTKPGTRLMQPQYGINIESYLFEPLDSLTIKMIRQDILYGLSAFEPRISDINIDIETDEILQHIDIDISFSLVFTGNKQNMKLTLKRIR